MLKWQEISFLIGLADLVPRLYHLWHFIHIFSHNTERYTLFSPDPGASAVGISFIEDKWELLFVFCHLIVVYSPLPDCLQWPTCTTRWSHCSSLWNHITAPSCVTSCWGELTYCNVNHTVRFDRWWQSYCRWPRNTCTAVFTWSIKEAKKSFFFFFDILFEITKPPANLRRF